MKRKQMEKKEGVDELHSIIFIKSILESKEGVHSNGSPSYGPWGPPGPEETLLTLLRGR